ncbi:hydrolase [Galdieria sulphuraria]|uniref:Hydrolase n=1 Tax=Galdieria sulphuraria TaxID=130081 RepID=M2XS14_GALSU|nr:hydrolase [Galdieria sulphuraria]EME26448.1 hydrolase [Galdieria sulphuraria]|eukprot:XP_005702968.1 hydrolase [Galdieria sulphuraria]
MSLVNGLLYAAVTLVGSLVAGLYVFQENLLYHPSIPTRRYEENPNDYLMAYRDIFLETEDGIRIHGWLVLQSDSRKAPTFLYFHGNAGNISHRLSDVQHFYSRVACNVLMVSYRGYGDSEGRPSEKGIQRDAAAAFRFIRSCELIDPRQLFVFGRSIGGAVAISLAQRFQREIKGVVVENTFTSIDDMIDYVLPALRWCKFLNRNKWNSAASVSSLTCPILFLSGLRDELVPPKLMQQLYDLATHSVYRQMVTFPDGTHNDTWFRGGSAYYDAIAAFVHKALSISDK